MIKLQVTKIFWLTFTHCDMFHQNKKFPAKIVPDDLLVVGVNVVGGAFWLGDDSVTEGDDGECQW